MKLNACLSVAALLVFAVSLGSADATDCHVTSHFSSQGSIGKAVIESIRGTNERLTLALYGFDNSDLADELLQLVKKKVVVRLKIDTTRSASKKIVPIVDKLNAGVAEVQASAPTAPIHIKFVVIDSNGVITGA